MNDYPNKMIVPIAVKILTIFCPVAVQIVPDYCSEAPAAPDYYHHRPQLPLSFDPIADYSHGFVFLEDNTEYLVLEFVRD